MIRKAIEQFKYVRKGITDEQNKLERDQLKSKIIQIASSIIIVVDVIEVIG